MRGTKRRIRVLILVGVLGTAVCFGCQREGGGEELEEIRLEESADAEKNASESGEEESSAEKEPEKLFVFVCGQVYHPGVYELPVDSRVCDAIQAAGGVTENGAGDFMNQAAPVEDGSRIYVPSKEETAGWNPAEPQSDQKEDSAAGQVNINTAGKEELMTLTGIGEKRAEEIIRYRSENGAFQALEDLMKVPGIKEGTFDKIKEDISI